MTADEETACDLVRCARGSRQIREWYTRFDIAREPQEAFTTCEDMRLWLEELACNPCLDHEGEHCVGELLRGVRVMRAFLRQLINDAGRGSASATTPTVDNGPAEPR